MSDQWDSGGVTEDVWDSATNPGVTWNTVVRTGSGSPNDGTTVHNNLTGRSTEDAHPISAITGLQEALDSAGGVTLPIAQSGVTDLVDDLAAKADTSDIPDISGLQATSEKNQPNGYAGLDGDGTIPDNRIPASIARDTEIGTQITAHDGSGTAHSTQFAGKVSTSVLSASGKGYVAHGSTASTARPSGYASVEWFGSVEPDNWIDGDTWNDPS